MSLNDVITTFRVPMTLLRRAGAGAIVDGRYEPAAQVAATVELGTHPAHGPVADLLPDHVRVRAKRWFYSQAELRAFSEPDGSSSDADVVTYQGKHFEIFLCEPWVEGGFFRALGCQLPRAGQFARIFFGPAAPPTSVNAAFTTALPGLFESTQREVFCQTSVASGQKFYFALPHAFGVPSFSTPMALAAMNVIIDDQNYDVFASTTMALGDVTVVVS